MNFLHRANHRRVEGGRDLWQLSGLGPVAQDNVQVILGITKNGDSTTSLCSLCQGSVTLTVKSCVLMFGWNLLILVCAHHLWPWNGIQPVSITFALSVRCLYTLLRLCPELFCSAGSTVPAVSLCSCPLLMFVAPFCTLCTVSLCALCSGAQSWALHSSCGPSRAGSPPSAAGTAFD